MPALAHQTPFFSAPRVAGVLYAVIIATGLTAELALRGPLLNAVDPATAILANPLTFRLSLLGDSVMIAADVALALLFYYGLRSVSEPLARAAMILRFMQAALIAVSLTLLTGVPTLLAQGETALALWLTQAHATGYDVGLLFFGANSLIMASLLCRAGVPQILCAGIAVSGMVYLTGGLVRVLAPDLLPLILPAYLVPMLAETALCLWLLITGRLGR